MLSMLVFLRKTGTNTAKKARGTGEDSGLHIIVGRATATHHEMAPQDGIIRCYKKSPADGEIHPESVGQLKR